MDDAGKKRVDESWKEQAEREKRAADAAPPSGGGGGVQVPGAGGPAAGQGGAAPHQPGQPGQGAEELPQARFDLFVSGLAMETLIALGDMAHPTTRKQAANLPQAKYLIDLLGMLEEKTAGNLSPEEEKLFKDALYQLRMRYLNKTGG